VTRQSLTIDCLYEYEIEDVLEGGMGYVLLMSLVERSYTPPFMDTVLDYSKKLQDHFRYPYRKHLAAKTVKEEKIMPIFARECNMWLGFEEPGIVPLLKVVNINDSILALMPQYTGSLRDLINVNSPPPMDRIKSLYQPVSGLAAVHEKYGIVHQDIKPENLLYESDGRRLSLLLSDWGIANVQSGLLPKNQLKFRSLALETMGGFGTVPYMAPERFASYISDIRADIFSLGIVFFEILAGIWPYHSKRPVVEQILSGEYYERALLFLSRHFHHKAYDLILSMIHPSEKKRLHDYSPILKFIKSL
jgi:serine/threonine protein kinase